MAKEKGAVVVTGASTGIGRATALHLDEQGYRVFAGVRKQADADSLKEEGSERLTPITIDVAKQRLDRAPRARRSSAPSARRASRAWSTTPASPARGPVEHLPVDEFQKVIDVNLVGQYAVTQAFLPLLRRGGGTIVFITSIGGRVASPFFSPYNAAKFGLEGMADSLRRELKPWKEMDVVVVEPGSIATPIWEKGNDNFDAASKRMGPEAKRLYGPQMDRLKEVTVETAERGLEPIKVAKVIEKAIRKDEPQGPLHRRPRREDDGPHAEPGRRQELRPPACAAA